jgi:hypothetical protein
VRSTDYSAPHYVIFSISQFLLNTLFSNTLSLRSSLNPLNAELNPICSMLALLGAHHFLHVSRIRVNVRDQVSHPYKTTGKIKKGCFFYLNRLPE